MPKCRYSKEKRRAQSAVRALQHIRAKICRRVIIVDNVSQVVPEDSGDKSVHSSKEDEFVLQVLNDEEFPEILLQN